ncbi:Serine/threonine-protein kinase PrkC [Streptomyces hundungensis]|uniref:non-specific serine/threonine protein kinase n=2 Tax=Streptomyces hundungensis TaxID=1077946 RepID=A0A387HGA9_9ACTN|nr:Serine/threonine-protein kinase PrkC [Streptomyces hundungensis]
MVMPGTRGLLIAGRYRLGETIGQGGMGRVWRAADEILDRQVAVKEMRIDEFDAEDSRIRRERSLREARATARIDHPNVVRVYDVVAEESDRLWIVMELVESRSLEKLLVEDGPVTPREAARIGVGLAAALVEVHAVGVLHRDIKPGNVLLGAGGRVVLTDFGIAAIQDATALTVVGMLVGSPDYMAPERVTGKPQGSASDIWSLGATLCAAVGGRSPFSRASTLATLHAVLYEEPELPPAAGPLAPLLERLLVKDPELRPGLAEITALLTPIAAPPTVPAPHPPTLQVYDTPQPWPGRSVGAQPPSPARELPQAQAQSQPPPTAQPQALAQHAAPAPPQPQAPAPPQSQTPPQPQAPSPAQSQAPAPVRPQPAVPVPAPAQHAVPAPAQHAAPAPVRPQPAVPAPVQPQPGVPAPARPGGAAPDRPAGASDRPGGTTSDRSGAPAPAWPGATAPASSGGTAPGQPGGTAPHPPGGAKPAQPGTPAPRRRRIRAWMPAVALGVVALAVAAVLIAKPAERGGTASGSGGPVTPTVEGTSRPPSATPPPGSRDETGFAWIPPEGWTRTAKSPSNIHYHAPGGQQEIAASYALVRGGDLMTQWQGAEAGSHDVPGYRKIRLERTTFHEQPAIVWDYDFTQNGVPWKARQIGFDEGGKSYQVNTWYQADTETAALGAYDAVTSSFTPL